MTFELPLPKVISSPQDQLSAFLTIRWNTKLDETF